MPDTSTSRPRLSAPAVERVLAVLLLGLLATYALGTAASDAVPSLAAIGVLAVHLSVVVAGLFPVAILGRATLGVVRPDATGPRRVEVGVAAVALASLASALVLALDGSSDVTTALFGCAAGAVLVLAGLVAGRS